MAKTSNPDKGLKLQAGSWWVDCYLNGKRLRARCSSKSEAQKALTKMKDQARRDRLFPEEAAARRNILTISELVATYSNANRNNNKNWKRIELYGSYWEDFLGDRLISDVRPSDVERYKSKRIQEGRAPATINKEVKR